MIYIEDIEFEKVKNRKFNRKTNFPDSTEGLYQFAYK